MNFKLSKASTPIILDKFSGEVLGDLYTVNSQYIMKNGKPYICKMGEFHFSRYDCSRWESELIKMKEGGIDAIASYVFWIHHEECEGEFDFAGNNDIGKFIFLCKKLGLPFILRIGPWVHGEAKNGGFPDWLLKKTGGKVRTASEPYLTYVRRFFEAVYKEIHMHSDAILAIQIENELRRERDYALTLKNILTDIGFCAPIWTFTGWGGSDSPESCPAGEVLCLYGGYPEAPWMQHLRPIGDTKTYSFLFDRDDENIGADILKDSYTEDEKKRKILINNTPFLTCELGGGNQITYHRRPIISTEDVLSIAICKLGSGANGLGYYVYHGGLNPIGKTTYMQESRESGYPNDLPLISYDFQAPIGKAGQIRKSYFEFSRLHSFIDFCGEELAKMPPYMPDRTPEVSDTDLLRVSVRSDGERGYVFINNHFHLSESKALSDEINIRLNSGSAITIPISCEAHAMGIFPFNFTVGEVTLDWICATPHHREGNTYYFSKINGIEPKIRIDGKELPFTDSFDVGAYCLCLLEDQVSPIQSEVTLPLCDSGVSSRDFFSHIINIDGTKPEFAPVTEYKFTLPHSARYVKIRGVGNVGALYFGEELISDWYFYGRDWIVDVRRLPEKSELSLLVLPLTEKDKNNIYFETDMPLGKYTPEVFAVFDEAVYDLT